MGAASEPNVGSSFSGYRKHNVSLKVRADVCMGQQVLLLQVWWRAETMGQSLES